MKKNDLIILFTTGAYSYLFYKQSAGINYLLFTVILVIATLIKTDFKPIKNISTAFLLTLLGSITSAICILFYGNTLSVIANIISISLMASFALEQKSSLIIAGLHAFYSYVASIPLMLIDLSKIKNSHEKQKTRPTKHIAIFIIPIIICAVFFFLYRASNPLFKNFTENINFDFISFPWIQFTFTSFIILYGFFYQRLIPEIHTKDINANNNLNELNHSKSTNSLFGIKINLSNESLAGNVLFSSLNILLLSVNILDITYLWISNTVPEGVNASESVHQSIGTLITSIILAIAIILILFRGNLNFYKTSTTIKILAYFWIVQNAFMVFSTILRNQLYVNEFSLTYKRIGVYVYLLLVLIGLCTTLIKIYKAKSNWYLFRTNAWLFYFVLILSCAINWDNLITNFNLKQSKSLDKEYLLSLSETNTGILFQSSDFLKSTPEGKQPFQKDLNNKAFQCLQNYHKKDWQSWTVDDTKVYESIKPKLSTITSLDFTLTNSPNLKTLNAIEYLENLRDLNLSNCQIDDLSSLQKCKHLTTLTYNTIKPEQIEALHKAMPNLTIIRNQSIMIRNF